MKNEAELCTIIKNSMIDGVKIPDPSGNYTQTSIRCFDGIGMLPASTFGEDSEDSIFICWEAKYLNEPKAFSLKAVEPHQAYYLSSFSTARNINSLLILGVVFGRGDKRVFVFKWTDTMKKLFDNGFSFHKKELMELPFNFVEKDKEKDKFTFKFEYLIGDEELNKVYGNINNEIKKLEALNGNSEI